MKITNYIKLNVMMKVGLLLVGAMLTFNASAQAFQNKTNVITLGFGLDPYNGARYSAGFGNNYKRTGIGPIMLTYERGITELLGIGRIGVGGGIGQSFWTSKDYHNNGFIDHDRHTARTAIMLRAAYHFDFGIDKLDVYAGAGGAVNVHSHSDVYYNNSGVKTFESSSIRTGGDPNVFGGVRYYFTDAFGVYGEVGYGTCAIHGGFAFKF